MLIYFDSISRVARPNSEMSRVPSKTMKPVYQHSTGIQIKSDGLFGRNSKSEKESQNLCLVLPALEVIKKVI